MKPVVPALMKLKMEYITLKMVPPRPMAPIYETESRCPISIMSTNPNKGTVMLLMMFGIASFRIL